MNNLLAIALVLLPFLMVTAAAVNFDILANKRLEKQELPEIDPSINIGLFKVVAKRNAPVTNHHRRKPPTDKKHKQPHLYRRTRHVESQNSDTSVLPAVDSGIHRERVPKPLVGITLDQAEGRVPIRIGRAVDEVSNENEKDKQDFTTLDELLDGQPSRSSRGVGKKLSLTQNQAEWKVPKRRNGLRAVVGITRD